MTDDTVGLRFGDYEVLADEDGVPITLGIGGSGVTFHARHAILGTDIALKKIRDEHVFDREARDSFMAQAREQALVAEEHSGFARISGFGEQNGTCFYAMEWCDGGTLEDYVKKFGPIPLEAFIPLFYQLADAMAFAHGKGVIHRDFKPSNVLLKFRGGTGQMEAKITDFGLGVDAEATSQIWTARYASPEQMRGAVEIDARTDLFSIGLSLWYLLEGELPFKGDMAAIVTDRLKTASYRPLLPASWPTPLRDLISGMVELDPAKRIGNMREVIERLLAAYPDATRIPTGWLDVRHTKPAQISPRGTVVVTKTLEERFNLSPEGAHRYGKAFVGTDRQTHRPVRVVILHRDATGGDAIREIREHATNLSDAHHRCIVPVYGVEDFEEGASVIYARVEGDLLYDYLYEANLSDLTSAKLLLREIAEGFDFAAGLRLPGIQLKDSLVVPDKDSAWGSALRLMPMLLPRGIDPDGQAAGGTIVASIFSFSVEFPRFIYRLVAGREASPGARFSKAAYQTTPALSEEGNRILAAAIAGDHDELDCCELLNELFTVEAVDFDPTIIIRSELGRLAIAAEEGSASARDLAEEVIREKANFSASPGGEKEIESATLKLDGLDQAAQHLANAIALRQSPLLVIEKQLGELGDETGELVPLAKGVADHQEYARKTAQQAQQDIAAVKRTIEDLSGQLERFSAEVEAQVKLATGLEAESTRLRDEAETLKSGADKIGSASDESDHSQLSDQIVDLRTRLETCTADRAAVLVAFDALKERLSGFKNPDLQLRVQKGRDSIGAAAGQIDHANAALDAAEEALAGLLGNLSDRTTVLDETRGTIQASADELKGLVGLILSTLKDRDPAAIADVSAIGSCRQQISELRDNLGAAESEGNKIAEAASRVKDYDSASAARSIQAELAKVVPTLEECGLVLDEAEGERRVALIEDHATRLQDSLAKNDETIKKWRGLIPPAIELAEKVLENGDPTEANGHRETLASHLQDLEKDTSSAAQLSDKISKLRSEIDNEGLSSGGIVGHLEEQSEANHSELGKLRASVETTSAKLLHLCEAHLRQVREIEEAFATHLGEGDELIERGRALHENFLSLSDQISQLPPQADKGEVEKLRSEDFKNASNAADTWHKEIELFKKIAAGLPKRIIDPGCGSFEAEKEKVAAQPRALATTWKNDVAPFLTSCIGGLKKWEDARKREITKSQTTLKTLNRSYKSAARESEKLAARSKEVRAKASAAKKQRDTVEAGVLLAEIRELQQDAAAAKQNNHRLGENFAMITVPEGAVAAQVVDSINQQRRSCEADEKETGGNLRRAESSANNTAVRSKLATLWLPVAAALLLIGGGYAIVQNSGGGPDKPTFPETLALPDYGGKLQAITAAGEPLKTDGDELMLGKFAETTGDLELEITLDGYQPKSVNLTPESTSLPVLDTFVAKVSPKDPPEDPPTPPTPTPKAKGTLKIASNGLQPFSHVWIREGKPQSGKSAKFVRSVPTGALPDAGLELDPKEYHLELGMDEYGDGPSLSGYQQPFEIKSGETAEPDLPPGLPEYFGGVVQLTAKASDTSTFNYYFPRAFIASNDGERFKLELIEEDWTWGAALTYFFQHASVVDTLLSACKAELAQDRKGRWEPDEESKKTVSDLLKTEEAAFESAKKALASSGAYAIELHPEKLSKYEAYLSASKAFSSGWVVYSNRFKSYDIKGYASFSSSFGDGTETAIRLRDLAQKRWSWAPASSRLGCTGAEIDALAASINDGQKIPSGKDLNFFKKEEPLTYADLLNDEPLNSLAKDAAFDAASGQVTYIFKTTTSYEGEKGAERITLSLRDDSIEMKSKDGTATSPKDLAQASPTYTSTLHPIPAK